MSTVPVGGSTGLDHESSEAVTLAARWLATTPPDQHPRPIVPELRRRFGLNPVEACQALREANLIKARAT
ncbi:hypothetical protein [Consotaella salsifontis]|uniref:Uncharacterized protein n=1 Tax=Consotaella salsifontis TaxID=1365950 RepID=A0A1T4SE07_9HYPH|nr:hypothetical protein [Consotaella salsifontis]SKA26452.1 hypothetical protein SAMN05428963_11080 [Consotaella salsifontis]